MHYSVFPLEVSLLAQRFVYAFDEPPSIVRMHALDNDSNDGRPRAGSKPWMR
jgi:hypothetical protein